MDHQQTKTSDYLHSLLPEQVGLLRELEEKARAEGIPIMDPEGMHTLVTLLGIHKPSRILEIGTAIGYSGLRMLSALPDAHLVTIERDAERAETARAVFERSGTEERVTLLEADALEAAPRAAAYAPFDVLFIDAAKGQYEKYFQMYEPLLQHGGLILSDNVLFKGFVAEEQMPESRRIRSMTKRLQAFNEMMMQDPRFDSTLLPVGDGLMVSRKK
ncbi:SAM-dependent methyltransferase [Alkalicoccus urumqiensis]|uniref:tRNA 5-hydroxyuridine methyltransferase n=2 Tax=Alkalicoccus urumqiensis TaxID=1548213 RepID=A0A2P6MFJ8_ALKUR|nr:SAM-dependent methyltransferase [Alkalicoccus urumqiensis]